MQIQNEIPHPLTSLLSISKDKHELRPLIIKKWVLLSAIPAIEEAEAAGPRVWTPPSELSGKERFSLSAFKKMDWGAGDGADAKAVGLIPNVVEQINQ